MNALEFYETPAPFVHWLLSHVNSCGLDLPNTVILDPCVGDGAIPAALGETTQGQQRLIVTNDLDVARGADSSLDATTRDAWEWMMLTHGRIDWTIANPPFSQAHKFIEQALRYSRVGVAMHVRCTLNEPLKRPGLGRSLLRDNPPTMILWLPRFKYAKNPKGKWATDSATCCWLVWTTAKMIPVIDYAPDWLIGAAQGIERARARRQVE